MAGPPVALPYYCLLTEVAPQIQASGPKTSTISPHRVLTPSTSSGGIAVIAKLVMPTALARPAPAATVAMASAQ